MAGSTPHSAGRRWMGKFGFALVQAAVLGCLFGAAAFYPVNHARDEEDASPVRAVREGLEGLEWVTYDWRARELGAVSEPTRADDVVVVAVNDDTLVQARANQAPGISLQPWPREIIGGVVNELVQEGASLVVVDFLFPDLSPHACASILPSSAAQDEDDVSALDDDWRFRAQLDAVPDRSVLAFNWGETRPHVAASELTPFGVLIGRPASLEEQWPLVQRILSDRRQLFAVPDGRRQQLWAGAASIEDGKALARLWHLKGAAEVRALEASDTEHPITPQGLLLSMAEVDVEGLDAAELPEVADLGAPVPALLGRKSAYGSVSARPEHDGLVRAFPQLVAYHTRADNKVHLLPSAPLAAAMKLAGTKSLRYRDGRLEVGSAYSIPMDRAGFSLIRWEAGSSHASAGSMKRAVPAWNVVVNMFDALQEQHRHNLNDIDRRAVILTNTTNAAADFKSTPIGKTPGGAVLAQALSNILHSDGIRRARPNLDFSLALLLAFSGALLALSLSGSLRTTRGAALYFFSVAMAAAVYLVAARYVFIHQHLWICVASPLLALTSTFLLSTVYAFRSERQVKDFIHAVLGRYVSPEVARHVISDLSLMAAERRPATILFSDIEGFTAMSEALSAERLVQLMNEYFTEMTAVIRRNEGHVDKYIGDAIMAFWGAPIRTDRHAQLACESALEMRAALFRRREDWERRFGHQVRFRIGVNSGEVVVGDMGSDLKSNYTVMGDAVNLASRLEGANKAFGTSILVGESTVQAAGAQFVFREIDRVRVKGRAEPTRVYELMGLADQVPPGRARQIEPFARALDAYHRQRFLEALELFERCRELADPVAATYLLRCEGYLGAPPPADWDGVYALQEK